MKTYLECIPCFIRQTIDATRKVCDDPAVVEATLKKVLREISEFDLDRTPPEMAQKIHRLIKEETSIDDPYDELKSKSNIVAQKIATEQASVIAESEFPFATAVRFAIAGNIIDFGAKTTWDDELIHGSFAKATGQYVDEDCIRRLYDEIATAKTVLYLGDNAGESVFDKLLIENFPGDTKVCYAVKESPIINDVTRKEAMQIKMEDVAEVISNGADFPGTVISECSEEFVELFNGADVVISKGQGNFETLSSNSRKIYFLFQVKCGVIAENYGYNLGDWKVIDEVVSHCCSNCR